MPLGRQKKLTFRKFFGGSRIAMQRTPSAMKSAALRVDETRHPRPSQRGD